MVYVMKRFKFAGLRFYLGLSHVRVKKIRVRGREYVQHVIYLPKEIAKQLYREANEEEDKPLPIILLIAPAKWYHLINWSEYNEKELEHVPENILKELKTLGLLPGHEDEVSVLIEANEDELKDLGINPDKLVSLNELRDRLKTENSEDNTYTEMIFRNIK